ncbi:hypothetical protein ABT288_03515 [Streptomyces sp. NPDC001093]|uniref:hypothetical protein n=1 Tax=Streptomyces sp. NPDC001093 TaxID=3154376 RepID=UPI00331D5197
MSERNAKRRPKRPFSRVRRSAETIRHLRKRIGLQEQNLLGEFMQGAAYKLGSGAVSLIILWWETRH